MAFDFGYEVDEKGIATLTFDRPEVLNAITLDIYAQLRDLFASLRFEDEVKIRVEHETEVEDADQIHSILENLGFEVMHRYQKKREEWQVGGVTVALDHTPIGDFVEFEGDGAGAVARRFGFDLEQSERLSYVELYERYREKNPDAPPDMVFP